ncbi:MAG: cupin domain-containing protein [Sphingomonadaceae bacterium]|nr:cupin domain-containing protein [Sphingomonas sp.]MBV9881800.1 cupin domain-containing protein [Sphingomonadaceae bacterium]
MDVLDEILSPLRLTGGVVIDAEFSGDYCVRAEFTPNHCAPWFAMPQTLISYHYVRSGQTTVSVEGMPPATLGPGSIVILPRNDPHRLSSDPSVEPSDVDKVSWVTEEGVHRVSLGNAGDKTLVWCGFLGADETARHPLIEALPPMLTLTADSEQAAWVESSLKFLSSGSASPELVARLAELFLAQAIREYVETLPPSSKGWLRGLTDPAVSKALSIIHNHYTEELDVETLAREAGVSRTVLGERFAELIGESPMRYCAAWRMRMASNMLRDKNQSTANVAYAVGFSSEAAFNRAFKREFGVPPATWKREAEERERVSAGELAAHDAHPDQLIVSGPPTIINWISQQIQSFQDDNPDLFIQLDPNPTLPSFGESSVDCTLQFGAEPPPDLAVEELFRLEFTPMCSPEFLRKNPNIRTPDDLRRVARITPIDPWWEEWWRYFGLERPEGTARSMDMGAQVLDGQAAANGRGVALLTPLFWRLELAKGRLVRPLPHLLDGGGTYWLLYPKERGDWPKIQRFSAWLRGLCEEAKIEPKIPTAVA